jgi:hypothetical protein
MERDPDKGRAAVTGAHRQVMDLDAAPEQIAVVRVETARILDRLAMVTTSPGRAALCLVLAVRLRQDTAHSP